MAGNGGNDDELIRGTGERALGLCISSITTIAIFATFVGIIIGSFDIKFGSYIITFLLAIVLLDQLILRPINVFNGKEEAKSLKSKYVEKINNNQKGTKK